MIIDDFDPYYKFDCLDWNLKTIFKCNLISFYASIKIHVFGAKFFKARQYKKETKLSTFLVSLKVKYSVILWLECLQCK